jgi:hypothetical protein
VKTLAAAGMACVMERRLQALQKIKQFGSSVMGVKA